MGDHRARQVRRGEIKNKAKDGTFFWVDTTIVPFVDDKGKPYKYVAIHADVTERRRIETAAAQLAAIVESSEDAIVGKDLRGVVTSWNRGAEKVFGYGAAEMVGRPIMRLIPADRMDEEARILEVIGRGQVVGHYETVRVRKDAERIDVSVTVSPIRDSEGRVIGASKVARDITRQKSAEAAVRRLNSSLERRVAKRTAQLEAANRELEAFSYSVSHDLRAPLRAADGFSQAVLEDYGALLPDEGRRFLRTIRESTQRMGELIDDLLAFARLSRQELSKRPIDMDKLVRGALEELAPSWRGRKVNIEVGELPVCTGDPSMLRQVWLNLLSNALKYTQKRESAEIQVGCAKAADGEAFFVRDNGTGFDMSYAGSCSASSSACTAPTNTRGRGSASPSCSASSTGTADACGRRPPWTAGPHSTSPWRRRRVRECPGRRRAADRRG